MKRPIWSSEVTAAGLLDMKPGEFRSLVEAGHLPRPYEIAPGKLRWKTEMLEKIANGDAVEGGIVW
ncbi:hypothetical protein KTN05_13925 [Paracoccus sp. Z118]|uniref:hypothetical protein n=1 Tax=Paracoccus sp. Z118 TaxID=2851017 RepID=UPI001C2BBC79|nr:hypothetical protein [Paracoccus sp. Z118]MBV0892936.1 hypothetical protein [Paracoccus sp. Z118]